jgi:hypothetical protein
VLFSTAGFSVRRLARPLDGGFDCSDGQLGCVFGDVPVNAAAMSVPNFLYASFNVVISACLISHCVSSPAP